MKTLLLLLGLCCSGACLADQKTQRLMARLAEEADAFEKNAPNLIAEETLQQGAVPASSKGAAAVRWQVREIRSEYAFAKVGDPPEVREVRKVIAVDGKPAPRNDKGLEDLLKNVRGADDRSRKKLLEGFEKYGLVGTATDFGQLLLLFTRSAQEKYSFSFAGEMSIGAERCHVFTYQQQDGPGALTVFDSGGRQQPQIKGEIWVTKGEYRPIRIRLASVRKEKNAVVRDEAAVEYKVLANGVLAPAAVHHRQYRDGAPWAENNFRYGEFRTLGQPGVK